MLMKKSVFFEKNELNMLLTEEKEKKRREEKISEEDKKRDKEFMCKEKPKLLLQF